MRNQSLLGKERLIKGVSVKIGEAAPWSRYLQCHYCLQNFDRKKNFGQNSLRRHVKDCRVLPFKCRSCERGWSDQQSLSTHICMKKCGSYKNRSNSSRNQFTKWKLTARSLKLSCQNDFFIVAEGIKAAIAGAFLINLFKHFLHPTSDRLTIVI